jgi:periplasmic divalent cation tolerance protein
MLVITTAPDSIVAARIAHALVAEHLAACCNIIPGVESIYRWEGKVVREQEVVMLIKTVGSRVEAVSVRLRAMHPYDLPEIIATPITRGSADYLDWIAASSSGKPPTRRRSPAR